MTLAFPSQEELEGGKNSAAFAHALLGSLAFCVEPGIIIGEEPVVLFFGKNLRQTDCKFSRFDQVAPE